jgi:hypothetical protein
MKNTSYIVFAILIFLLSGTYSFAQNDTSKDGRGKEVRKVIKEKFMEKLYIDEKTTDDYLSLYYNQRKTISDLKKQRRNILNYIEENPGAADISQKIDDMIDTETKINDTRRQFFNEMKKILSPQQIAGAIVFQKEIRKFLKHEINKRKHNEDR